MTSPPAKRVVSESPIGGFHVMNFGGTVKHIQYGLSLGYHPEFEHHLAHIGLPRFHLRGAYGLLTTFFGASGLLQCGVHDPIEYAIEFTNRALVLPPLNSEWDFAGGKTHFVSRRNGITFLGPPLGVMV